MYKLKYLLSLSAILLMFLGYSQNYGGLLVKGFKNTTLDLNDNVEVDSIHVKIVNQTTREEKTVVFTSDMKERPLLKTGKYELVCSVKNEREWVVKDITVSADMITFVELLYEPEQKLTRSQKRKRKKRRFIFER